jgi:indolepyruvate ferredoxin oxidoreductase
LLGDSIAANLFMLGFAFQEGLVPLSEAALTRAIELNGVAANANKAAFLWGRRAAVDLQQVERLAAPARPVVVELPESLDTVVRTRMEFLTSYQNSAYARRYEALVTKVRRAEAALGTGHALSLAVAKSLFKLMAYKDEYEVARLYTDGHFAARLEATFDGDFTVKFHLAPPLFSKRDAQGHLVKAQYGSWMWHAFRVLARLKFLRGTALDPFGKTEERRMERQLIAEYAASIDSLLPHLREDNLKQAIELAGLPMQIRGFGHVKLASVHKAKAGWHALEQEMRGSRQSAQPRQAA